MNSRRLPLPIVAFLFAANTTLAAYPEKALRIVVPFPPGGNIDITARTIAPGLTGALGQQVLIDNRGGATGTKSIHIPYKGGGPGLIDLIGGQIDALSLPPGEDVLFTQSRGFDD